jgi:hypothetical protein
MANTTTETKAKTVKIKLPRLKSSEDTDVYVSVNEYECVIKRGHEVEVPEFVAEVLRNQELAEMKADEFNDSVVSK